MLRVLMRHAIVYILHIFLIFQRFVLGRELFHAGIVNVISNISKHIKTIIDECAVTWR